MIARNTRTQILLAVIAIGMLSLGFYSKTLYDTFCRITGFGGTPKIAADGQNFAKVIDRKITVKFDTNVAPDLPWTFEPEVRGVTVKMGQTGLAYYTVTNTADHPVTGVATFNVSPTKAAPYFVKTECFCFTDQTLQPGEVVTMPVMFYIEPEMDESPRHEEITEVFLSYTFFESENQPEDGTAGGVSLGAQKALN